MSAALAPSARRDAARCKNQHHLRDRIRRTQETAKPLAEELGLQPRIVPAKETKELIAAIKSCEGNILVVGHSNTLPEIMRAFGIADPPSLGEHDYDNLFMILRTAGAAVTSASLFVRPMISIVGVRLFLVEKFVPRDALTFQQHDRDRRERVHVLQRISIHDQERRVLAFLDRADALIGAEQLRRVQSRGLQAQRRPECPPQPKARSRAAPSARGGRGNFPRRSRSRA